MSMGRVSSEPPPAMVFMAPAINPITMRPSNSNMDSIRCFESQMYAKILTELALKKVGKSLSKTKKGFIFAHAKGEMAEWSNALVLKTSEGHTSGGSNPSFSAI